MAAIHLDPYTLIIDRICQECGQRYSIGQFAETSASYFDKPYRYIDFCEQICLSCWLGVGPNDIGDAVFPLERATTSEFDITVTAPQNRLRDSRFHTTWPYDEIYADFVQGNLIDSYQWFFDHDWDIAVLPLTRVKALNPVFFRMAVRFFRPKSLSSMRLIFGQINVTLKTILSGVPRCRASSFRHLSSYPLWSFPVGSIGNLSSARAIMSNLTFFEVHPNWQIAPS